MNPVTSIALALIAWAVAWQIDILNVMLANFTDSPEMLSASAESTLAIAFMLLSIGLAMHPVFKWRKEYYGGR